MDFKIQISTVAKKNIRESIIYYKNNVSLKVAENFVKDYSETLQKIRKSPYLKVYYKNFRGLKLKNYPFIVFYQVDETLKIIFIKALFHTSQHPKNYPK